MRGVADAGAGDKVAGSNVRDLCSDPDHRPGARVTEDIHTVEAIQDGATGLDDTVPNDLLQHLANEMRLRTGFPQESLSPKFDGRAFGPRRNGRCRDPNED